MVHVRWLARQMEETGLPAHKAVIWGIERAAAAAPPPRPAEVTTVADPDEDFAVPLEIAGITQQVHARRFLDRGSPRRGIAQLVERRSPKP